MICIYILQYPHMNQSQHEIKKFIDSKGTIVSLQKLVNALNDDINSGAIRQLETTYKDFIVFDEQHAQINKKILQNFKKSTITFTPEQTNGIKSVLNFIMSEKDAFGFYGYAGTGKTTVLTELVSYLISNKYIKSVALTAPTNKAVNVMKNKFKPHLKNIVDGADEKNFNFDEYIEILEKLGIKIHFMTVHKLLNFQTDYSITGEMIFTRNKKNPSVIPEYELVIIDECSMISIDMIDSIFDELYNPTKNTRHTKVVFSGDPAQLPPVNEDNSVIFSKCPSDFPFSHYIDSMYSALATNVTSNIYEYLEARHKLLLEQIMNMSHVLLTNIVRTKIKDVSTVCNIFREWIHNDDISDMSKDMKCVYFYEYESGSNKIATPWFQQFLKTVRSDNVSILITWTNKQTNLYNKTIRDNIFGKSVVDKFVIGDILMLTDFYNLDNKLYTSEQIKIIGVSKSVIPLRHFTKIDWSKNKTIKLSKTDAELFDKIICKINEQYCTMDISIWILNVVKLGDNDHTSKLIVIDDTHINAVTKSQNESNAIILHFTKHLINTYKKNKATIEHDIVCPLWKQWHNIFIEPFANVNYGYSITCHKAQGSNFSDVYVDMVDILQNNKTTDAKRCAYTAVSRASNELHILI